ncbi:MAG: molybdopterin converting factor subunit 1 [Pseudomonadales bacterium]
MVKVLFFARIREQLGVTSVSLSLPVNPTVASLKQQLIITHGESWAEVLNAGNIVKAVNQEVVEDYHPLTDGDEVAFFPPVTGG